MAVVTYPYQQGFEDGGIPMCWTQETVAGSANWSVVNKTTGTPNTTPDDSNQKIRFVNTGATPNTTKLVTSKFDLSSVDTPSLFFKYSKTGNANGNSLKVYYKNEDTANWTEIAIYSENTADWTEAEVLLPEKSATYWIAFEAQTANNCDIQIDDITVKNILVIPCNPPRNLDAMVSNTYGCMVELSWSAPLGNYNGRYNVYRDDVLIASDIDTPYYTDTDFTTGESHEWAIKAICTGGESEAVTITSICSDECSPPQNFTYETSNAIHGSLIMTLNWELPTGYHKALYNVYKDGQLLASEISETSFVDDDITDGEHTWTVAAICSGEESEHASITIECENQCAPVRNLDITYDVSDQKVSLSWDSPGDLPLGWMSYSTEPVNAVSDQNEYPYQFTVAVRWSPEDLKAMGLDGAQLTEVAYVPYSTNASYFPGVWVGGNGLKPGMQVSNTYVQGKEVKPGEWNKVVLSEPLTIDASMELWIGYRITYTGGDVVGCDAGPQVAGKSNMIQVGNTWKQLTDVDPTYTYNLCIGGFIVDAEGKSKTLTRSSRPDITGYNIYRDGELIGTTADNTYSESGLPEDIYTYCVTATYNSGCESGEISKDFFAGNPCAAPENLTATVSSQSSTNVELEWDAVEPMYVTTTVFSENFDSGMPADWLNLDKDGDERTWRSSNDDFFYYYPFEYKGACMVSERMYMDEEWVTFELEPDNWLITPSITLTHGNAILEYYIAQLYGFSWDTYYEVLISTTGTDYDDFAVIHSEVLARTESENIWFIKTIDLSAYTGDVRLAFRHKNGGMDQVIGIQLDELVITEQAPKARTYNVYRNDVKIASDVSVTTFVDDGFLPGEHQWSVTAVCDEYGLESNPAHVTATVNIAGVDVVQLSAYPNPTTGKVFVKSSGERLGSVQLLDMSGRLLTELKNINNSETTIDLSGYASGVYFIKVSGQTLKLIKQ